MTSTAKVSSSLRSLRTTPAPAPRPARWGWLQLVREAFGGALLIAAWLARWTVTWAAVAGPLAPSREAPRAQVTSVERV